MLMKSRGASLKELLQCTLIVMFLWALLLLLMLLAVPGLHVLCRILWCRVVKVVVWSE